MIGARAAYDTESDRVVTFGGLAHTSFILSDDTWTYDPGANSWTLLPWETLDTGGP